MDNHQPSHWEIDSFYNKPDVLIIGSGIVGLQTAIHIKKRRPKLDVVIIERHPFGLGASTRNAGFACVGTISELQEDLKLLGKDGMSELLASRFKGLEILKSTLNANQMGFRPTGGFELVLNTKNHDQPQWLKTIEQFNDLVKQVIGERGIYQVMPSNEPFGSTALLIRNRLEGQLHPGKLISALQQLASNSGVRMLNGAKVLAFEDDSDQVHVELASGIKMKASRLIVATNGFSKKLLPNLDIKPGRNQVLITKPLGKVPFDGVYQYAKGYMYFRNVEKRVLIGGARHMDYENEQTDKFGTTKKIKDELTQALKEIVLPGRQFEIERSWSGILGLGGNRNPISKPISTNVYAAIRLGGMGIAIGSLLGKKAAEWAVSS